MQQEGIFNREGFEVFFLFSRKSFRDDQLLPPQQPFDSLRCSRSLRSTPVRCRFAFGPCSFFGSFIAKNEIFRVKIHLIDHF